MTLVPNRGENAVDHLIVSHGDMSVSSLIDTSVLQLSMYIPLICDLSAAVDRQ